MPPARGDEPVPAFFRTHCEGLARGWCTALPADELLMVGLDVRVHGGCGKIVPACGRSRLVAPESTSAADTPERRARAHGHAALTADSRGPAQSYEKRQV